MPINMKYLFILLFIYSNSTIAESIDNISVYYSPFANIKGDLPEYDFNPYDDYSYMSLDPGTAKGVKWVHQEDYVFFTEYLSVNTKSEGNGVISRDKYQSATVGTGIQYLPQSDDVFGLYVGMFAGVGGSRFKFNDTKYKGHIDLSGELGVIINKTFSISGGVKYQIIGYPTETMAELWLVNLNLGLWF